MSVGDRLARGDASAQFVTSSRGMSNFINDLIFSPEIVEEKYGLTPEQIEEYQQKRLTGAKLPELPTVEEIEEKKDQEDAIRMGFTVTDKRLPDAAIVEEAPLRYESIDYTPLRPILDRVLIMRVVIDEDMEELSDGSLRNKKTGFVMPAKWRQHSNIGIVLAIGDFVIMGGVRTELSEIVQPGDRVTFGDYNTELFPLDNKRAEALCDALQVNYVEHEDGLRIVRVQDIRGVEKPIREYESPTPIVTSLWFKIVNFFARPIWGTE